MQKSAMERILVVITLMCMHSTESFHRIFGIPKSQLIQTRMRHSTELSMVFNTFVNVSSSFKASCQLKSDDGVSLSDYMRLPADQYVCIKMPLDATLERIDLLRFNLTVPPVTFLNFEVSPQLICFLKQSDDSVIIESSECLLTGSPYVRGLNGCFQLNIKTIFNWIDTKDEKAILSRSNIYVQVDPPAPFKYFGKIVLEKAGYLAMSIALNQIENAFVESLAKDYNKWVLDASYRQSRAANGCVLPTTEADVEAVDITMTENPKREVPVETADPPPVAVAVLLDASVIDSTFTSTEPERAVDVPISGKEEKVPEATDDDNFFSRLVDPNKGERRGSQQENPLVISDDVCLLPGDEPQLRIEEAPQNARRIFTGVDIMCSIDTLWGVLTNYEQLHTVVPSLVKNEVLYRTDDGGARVSQVGGAKVLPGVTFTAKTVLDIKVYLEDKPIEPSMLGLNLLDAKAGDIYRAMPLKRGVFPRPYAETDRPHRDITMQNVLGEGDFDHYQGIWRMQSLPECALPGMDATRLTYAVEIKPKGFLPVGLIENRIAVDLKANLGAIRDFVETLDREKKKSRGKKTVVDVVDTAPAAAAAAPESTLSPVLVVTEAKTEKVGSEGKELMANGNQAAQSGGGLSSSAVSEDVKPQLQAVLRAIKRSGLGDVQSSESIAIPAAAAAAAVAVAATALPQESLSAVPTAMGEDDNDSVGESDLSRQDKETGESAEAAQTQAQATSTAVAKTLSASGSDKKLRKRDIIFNFFEPLWKPSGDGTTEKAVDSGGQADAVPKGQGSGATSDPAELLKENTSLRARIADLERQLASNSDDASKKVAS